MKCPVCKSEISELDEVCPVCKTNLDEYKKEYGNSYIAEEGYIYCPSCNRKIEDWRGECPYCRNKTDGNNNGKTFTNAQCLNIIASIYLVITILSIAAIFILIINGAENTFLHIIMAFSILFFGLTIYFLLKTIVDIFNKVN